MKIPEHERQVSAPGGANIRMNPNAPEAAFGVAVDTGAAIGKGLQNLGAVINEIEVKKQEDADRAAVTAAVSEYMKRSTSLMYDPEKGFLQAMGKGAEGLSERAGEEYKRMETDVRGTLKNKNQSALFDRMIVSHRQHAGQTIMMHEVKALAQWRGEEADKLSATTALAVSKDILNPAIHATLLPVAMMNARNKYGDQGEEQNTANAQKELSAMIILAAGYAATDGRYDDAEKFLTLNQDELEPVMYQKAMEELQKQALPARAQELAEKLFKTHGIDGVAAAREYVRETFQGKEETAYMSALEGYYADKRSERSELRENTADDLFGKINSGAGYSSVKKQLDANRALLGERNYYGLLDQLKKKHYVGEYASKRPETRRELEDRATLLSEIRSKMRFGEIASVSDLSEQYGKQLGDKDFKDLAFEIAKGKTGTNKKDRYDKSTNPLSVVSAIAKDNGIAVDPNEEFDFWEIYRGQVRAFEKQENREATAKELVDIGAKLVKDEVIKKDYNSLEKGLIRIGVPERMFTPDVVTTAKVYQIEAAGAIYNPELGISYITEPDGTKKGWLPDSNPKPLPKKEQKYPGLVNGNDTGKKNDGKTEAATLLSELESQNRPDMSSEAQR